MRVMVVNDWSEVPLAIQQVVNETVRDITRIEYESILKNQIPFLEKLHLQYFQTSTGPDNLPWAALAPSTVQRKGHNTILVDSRRLIASLTQSSGMDSVRDVSKKELIFGTRVPYSKYHQQDSAGTSPALAARGVRTIHKKSRFSKSIVGRVFRRTFRGLKIASRVLKVQMPGSSWGRSPTKTGKLPPRPHVGFNVQALKKFVDNVADGMMDQLKQKWR